MFINSKENKSKHPLQGTFTGNQGKENIKPESTADTSLPHADKWTAQFYGKGDSLYYSKSSGEAGYIKSTQTYNHPSVSVDIIPEIVIESISHSEKSSMFYTGLPDFITLQAVFEIESLIENGAEQLCTQSVGEMNMYSLGRKRMLRHVDEFFIGMMRLWMGLLVKHLEFLFKISRDPMCLNMITYSIYTYHNTFKPWL